MLAWGVPATFLLAALGFALLARHGSAFRWWSASFVLAAVGYALTVLPSEEGRWAKPLFEDTILLLAVAGTGVAFARRSGREPDFGPFLLIVGTAVAGAAVALVAFGSARHEILAIQSGCAAIMLLNAFRMRRDDAHPLEPVLFWLCIGIAGSLLLQNVLFLALPGEALTVATWRDTTWGFVFQLSGAATGILIAFCVMLASSFDIIGGLREVSQLDALTGVLNRRGLEHRAALLRERSPAGRPGFVVVADLDHFKTINDRFGHAAGDAVLCGFAALLEEIADGRGCVARLGGEEFAVVLSEGELADALRLAECVRAAVARVEWPRELAGNRITSSFGVAEWRPHEPLALGLSRADAFLYEAKAAGRDRVAGRVPAASRVEPERGAVPCLRSAV